MKRTLLLICTLLCANVLMAQTRFWIGDLQYKVTSTNPPQVEVDDANSSITTANIPAIVTYQGITYDVTSIGDWSFTFCSSSLTSVTIPNSVTSIGESAFYGCSSLTSVTIPNSVTSIGNSTFSYCSSLTSVNIPNSVTSIGAQAFSYCSSLTSVTCLRSNSPSLGDYVFDGTPNNKTLTIPCGCESEYTVWQNATTWASIDCIETIGSRFTIGDLTYEITSETEVKVQDCTESATSVVIPETVTYQGTTYSVTSIGDYAFNNCSSLTSVTIPNSVISIGYAAFSYCSSLTSVTIPNSVTSIGDFAFYNCSSFTSVTIPNSVTSIGNYAFEGCISLTSITIPNSVTSIGAGAFSGCSSLTSITIPNSVTTIYEGAFLGCNNLTTLNFNATNCNFNLSQDLVFPTSITTVNIGENVQKIPNYFIQSTSVSSIDIPNSVTSIGNWAFADCSSLTSVTIGDGITSIGEYAFDGCSSLTSVTIGNSVTSIGNGAFFECSNLTSVIIPNSVTSIASGAFNNCFFLQNVTCLATTPPTLEDNTVFPYPNIATLTVPCGTLEAYSSPTSFWNMFFMGGISEDGYEVVANVNNSAFGSVAIENNCSTATLTATANACYQFVGWNDGNTENPRLVTLSSDITLTANFEVMVVNNDITVTICEGQVYNENGFNVSETGTYTQILQTANGCDSIVTLTLNVTPSYNTNLTATICEGSELSISGFNVSEAGVYTQSYTAVNGCDSIVTLTVTALPVYNTNLTLTICEGTSMNFCGFNVTEAGVYTQSFTAVNGCDSVVTLTVTELPIIHTDLTLSICEGTTLSFSGFNVSEAGVYTQNLTSVNGCDSIVTLTVSVNPTFDTTINATINPGETYAEFGFNESEAGTYVQNLQTEFGCDSTITLVLSVNSSLLEAEIEEISFYPNPTKDKITFSQAIENVEVIDLTGKVIFTFTNVKTINIESLPSGAYYLRLTNEEIQSFRKFIKQ